MKIRLMSLLAVAWMAVAGAVQAGEPVLRVAADDTFRDALGEIGPLFTESTGMAVEMQYGESGALAEGLLDGEGADVCFPADAAALARLREKGAVDVALVKNVVVMEREGEDPAYLPAVVLAASPNRLQAMAFLDFLTSETARGVLAGHGFSLP